MYNGNKRTSLLQTTSVEVFISPTIENGKMSIGNVKISFTWKEKKIEIFLFFKMTFILFCRKSCNSYLLY